MLRPERARTLRWLLAALIGLGWPVSAMAQAAPRVRLAQGELIGLARDHDGAVFLGIPFARPPVGELRWRPPMPATWSGSLETKAYGPACAQDSFGWNAADATRSSEDCLYLDIATPGLNREAKRPVMVWIHGGANWAGSGAGVVQSSLARKDLVVVSLQYRLGAFGFLSHPALTAEGQGASGNYALMDLIAGLQWIQANIAAFGGDPANVTLFGHSAGGQDVGLLMLSPKARGLFARGILQSGTPGFGFAPRSLAENEAIGAALARQVGVADAAVAGPEALARLRAAPIAEILKASKALTAPIDDQGFIWTQAVVDGSVLPDAPDRLLAQGRDLAPMIVGSNAREIALFGSDPARARRWIAAQDAPVAQVLGKVYATSPADPDPVRGDLAMQVATDRMFRCPGEHVAAVRSRGGDKVWRYELEVPAPGGAAVTHGSELGFVFDAPEGPPMQAYWLNFAHGGDPNGPGLKAWPTYGSQADYLAFTATGPVERRGLGRAACLSLQRP